ncbi:hypothetical protein BGX28_002588 [Mortierella sp. GBA30]|nr:hypothetical protein BGX28_002588 [Mortierella sp. GBA30]
MSENVPTNAQILDMAREVLAVCQDHSLLDIINDLAITHSSEQTINRIFDGQVEDRCKLINVVHVKIMQVINDRLLDIQFLKAVVPQATVEPPPRDVVVLLSSSEDDETDGEGLPNFPKASTSNGRSMAEQEGIQAVSFATSALFSEDDRGEPRWKTPFDALERLHATRENDVNYKDELLDNRSLSPINTMRSPSEPLQDYDREPEEPTVIDLPTTPRRRLNHSAASFQLVSPLNQDAFSDWDYELIPSPGLIQGSPTVIFSSSSNGDKSIWRTADVRRKYSMGEMHKNSFSPPRHHSLATVSAPLSRVRSTTTSLTTSRSRPSPPITSVHSSREGSPVARDLQPRTPLSVDDRPHLEWANSRWEDDLEASDFEDREKLEERRTWDAIANASLSPPTIAHVGDTDESDLELMEEVFASCPKGLSSKRKGLTRSSSTRSLTNTKSSKKDVRARASPDLSLWGDDLNLDGPATLEHEIEERAKRRRMKAKRLDSEDDADSTDNSSMSRRKQLEKEAQKQEREAQKRAREERRAQEKAARELEQERKRERKEMEKRAKEEEKLAEKKAARELKIANRLTTKSETAKEMIVCIEESLYQSVFGQVLEDYLQPLECQVSLLKFAEAGAEKSSKAAYLGRTERNYTGDLCPARNVLFWRRSVTSRYNEEQDLFLPLDVIEVQLESFFLVYQTAEEFAQAIELSQLDSLLDKVKRDMRLRKSKERVANAIIPEIGTTRLMEDRRQRQRIILLITGMDGYLRGLRRSTTKRFQQAVLASIKNSPTESRTPPQGQEQDAVIDQNRIEQELLRLQLEQDCLVIHSSDEEESAQVIVSLTEQIGLLPYLAKSKGGMNMCAEGVRSGTDPEDTWIKTLQAIHMVTHTIARSIVLEYPTLKSLYDGYRQCTSVNEAQTMLEGIPVVNRSSHLGKVLSKRIYDVFMSDDPDQQQTEIKDNGSPEAGIDNNKSTETARNLPLSPYGGRFGVPEQPKSTKSIALAQANAKRSPFSKAKEGVKSKVHDWTDKEKNLEKRKELLTDFQSGYFAEFSELSRTGSKLWKATTSMVNADKALYMPNIIGTSLKTSEPTELVDILKGKISLVAISGTRFGEEQIETFMTPFLKQWPMSTKGSKVQLVELNIQENPLKAGLVRMMVPFVKKTIPEERHENYILHYKSIKHLKDPLSMQNSYLGYVFLVDSNCKIRWGAHGIGTEAEIKTLLDSVQRLSERGGRQKMSLPPQYRAHRIGGSTEARHTLELYLDYVCPFSAKLWNQVFHHVLPWLEKEHPGQIQIILRNQIQPWHPASTLTAEAALAVEKVDPSLFVAFSDILFNQQKSFFDEAVVEKTRSGQYKALASLAASTRTSSSSLTEQKVYDLLQIASVQDPAQSTNTGNKVTNDLKYFVKLGRQNGIHVSPTALWDGLVENSISSGWSLDAWREFIESKL